MTKEEFIEKAIECRKENEHFRIKKWCCLLNEEDGTCQGCPANFDNTCNEDDLFLDEIIRLKEEKAEKSEKVETNLEHYFKHTTFKMTADKVVLESNYAGDGVEEVFMKINGNTVQWLLSPYEPPKKYQMSQLCHDMIAKWFERYSDGEIERYDASPFIDTLIDFGFWHDCYDEIDEDAIKTLRTLLENAEVVEE